MADTYNAKYYGAFRSTSRTSAEAIVPELVRWFAPASVIDLGCGVGEWLGVFQAAGVRDIAGVDGTYVDRGQLAIAGDAFAAHDLATPFRASRRYDLAMSLEVAEHLKPGEGAELVNALVGAADVVLFSAAAPHQAGVRHVNCQWPGYWSQLFRSHGYATFDAIRPRFWNDARVDWWYRQNTLLYVSEAVLPKWPFLAAFRADDPLALVHPEMLSGIVRWGLEADRKYWDLWREHQAKSGDDACGDPAPALTTSQGSGA